MDKESATSLISDKPQNKPQKGYFERLSTNYDNSFIANLSLIYVNGGFKVLYSVALMDIFKNTYGLEPD